MKLLLLVTAILLTGCSTLGVITDRASTANDDALKAAEFTICVAASVGSIERRYNTEELLRARSLLCKREMVMINES